jgi:endonuclease/exonuclease/phosphatase family metal-dependent hydrolase
MMARVLTRIGITVGLLLLGGIGLFLWASSGQLSQGELARVRSYAPVSKTPAPDSLTITTYNVGYLSGMTNNAPVARADSLFYANMDQVVAYLREVRPDLVAAQEIDFGGARVAHVHQLDTLARRLRYPAAAQSVNWDERYLPFPYGRPAVHFGRTLSGQALLSRFPIRRHVRTVLPRPPQPFYRDAFYLDRLAQVGVLDLGGHSLAVINVHLEAFEADTRQDQARRVNTLYLRLANAGIPTLLVGDFNSTLSPAEAEAPVSSRKKTDAAADRTMQLLLKNTDLRPAIPPGTSASSTATYPADAPNRQIDYILYSPRFFRPLRAQRWCGAPHPPSDHCAVTATFRRVSTAGTGPPPEVPPSLLPSGGE